MTVGAYLTNCQLLHRLLSCGCRMRCSETNNARVLAAVVHVSASCPVGRVETVRRCLGERYVSAISTHPRTHGHLRSPERAKLARLARYNRCTVLLRRSQARHVECRQGACDCNVFRFGSYRSVPDTGTFRGQMEPQRDFVRPVRSCLL